MSVPQTMKAAVLHAINDIRIEDVPAPRIEHDDDVLIRIRSVGVCGSDIHYFREGRAGPFVVKAPIILGHECAGEIVEVGPAVTTLKVGQRVAVEPGVPCRKCEFCRTGKYNLCPDVVMGDARMLKYAGAVAELVRAGHQPVCALKAEAPAPPGLWLARYGTGGLAYLVIAVVQTALIFVMSYAIGFRADGGVAGILYGVILLAVFSI